METWESKSGMILGTMTPMKSTIVLCVQRSLLLVPFPGSTTQAACRMEPGNETRLSLLYSGSQQHLVKQVSRLDQLGSEGIEVHVGSLLLPVESLGHGLVSPPDGVVKRVRADGFFQVTCQYLGEGEGAVRNSCHSCR